MLDVFGSELTERSGLARDHLLLLGVIAPGHITQCFSHPATSVRQRHQLGLKLETTNTSVEVIVIDHIDHIEKRCN